MMRFLAEPMVIVADLVTYLLLNDDFNSTSMAFLTLMTQIQEISLIA